MKINGRYACPGSSRGHTWREAPADPRACFCARCGITGLVNKQGIIVAVALP